MPLHHHTQGVCLELSRHRKRLLKKSLSLSYKKVARVRCMFRIAGYDGGQN